MGLLNQDIGEMDFLKIFLFRQKGDGHIFFIGLI